MELQGSPPPVPGSGGTRWDTEAWTTHDLADAKLASVDEVLFAQQSGSERWPQEIVVITRANSPSLQG